jgi:nitrate/nitrite transporter NarK
MGIAAGAGLTTSGLAATFSPAILAAVGNAAAATSVAALGFTAGPALMAIGMILMMKASDSRTDSNFKADNPSQRSRADFSDEE